MLSEEFEVTSLPELFVGEVLEVENSLIVLSELEVESDETVARLISELLELLLDEISLDDVDEVVLFNLVELELIELVDQAILVELDELLEEVDHSSSVELELEVVFSSRVELESVDRELWLDELFEEVLELETDEVEFCSNELVLVTSVTELVLFSMKLELELLELVDHSSLVDELSLLELVDHSSLVELESEDLELEVELLDEIVLSDCVEMLSLTVPCSLLVPTSDIVEDEDSDWIEAMLSDEAELKLCRLSGVSELDSVEWVDLEELLLEDEEVFSR